ncbi:hypothetical protein TSOC_009888 [Tetrabaena socialis]|uniref:Phospholipid scramblase n=1 Tax=Tetrabaena socialis TaxID=47790 RepID=A0A2J7ZUP3_9CHLO|nr:hypothetical protein TSOC_009888 [Tetrabaena socialis]|eukprot:PNH03982.1 hypothetical protein TSOC_009888 [Tetrabaena socialis]
MAGHQAPLYAAAQPYSASVTSAPVQMAAMPVHMQHIENLESIPGVVVKETSSVVDAVMESIGGAYEAANKYHIKAMPGDKRPATVHGESGSWLPTSAEIDNLPQVFYVEEDSSCCLRATLAYCGSLNLRALKLNYYQGTSKNITVNRPCKLGACCCCPLEMRIMNQGQLVGMVQEDCDSCLGCCWEQCCLCTCTHKVMVGSSRASMVHKYSLKNSTCCCGRVNNCFGATCCKPNFFIDVVEPDGKLASVIQKTYGGDKGFGACCRCTFDFSNYILPFPPKATHWDRVALLTGLLSIEYPYGVPGYGQPPPPGFGQPQPYAQQPYAQPQQPYAQPQQPYAQPQQPYAQPYNGAMTQAPVQMAVMPMHMPHIENLESIPGVVVKETSSVVDAVMESIGGAYEAANKYHIKAMPGDKRPATVHGESGSWLPTGAEIDNLPQVFYVEEDSSCCLRAMLAYCGSLNLRALKLNYYQGTSRNITVDRPCKLGACCCCPLEMRIMNQGQLVGMVQEDCDSCCGCCWEQCCLCTSTQKVMVLQAQLFHRRGGAGRQVASVIQKTFGGGKGCAACFRGTFDFSNYILPFPPKATHWDRIALLTGLLSIEYAYHSRKGADNDCDCDCDCNCS